MAGARPGLGFGEAVIVGVACGDVSDDVERILLRSWVVRGFLVGL